MDYSAPAGEKRLQSKVVKVGGRKQKTAAEGGHGKVAPESTGGALSEGANADHRVKDVCGLRDEACI